MSSAAFLNYLHRTYAPPTSDAELLRRFSASRGEEPFRELVARHGPMVLGLCRRRLGEADADDAFQAVFLTLARRSASIRKPGALAAWLHGVAMRVCRNALIARSRRQARNARAVDRAIPDTRTELTARELLGVLDDELQHLPERERLPLVLVYWQGLTQAKAAQELGVTPGSLLGRLERGKQRLQRRLVARGFSEADLRVLLVVPVGAAALPGNLLAQTATLAIGGAAIPATIAALAAGASSVKWLTPVALAVVLASVGALGLTAAGQTEPAQTDSPKPGIVAEATPKVDQFGDPLPNGALARLGTLRFRQGGEISQFAFAPDGKTVAAASFGEACLWDVATGRKLRCFNKVGLKGLAISPDGKVLASAGWNQGISRWETATGTELPEYALQPQTKAHTLYFSPDGQVLACLAIDERIQRDVVVFFDAASGKELRVQVWQPNPSSFKTDGLRFAFAPDGKTCTCADLKEKTIVLYDSRTGGELRRFEGHASAAQTVAFSPDGSTLASTDINDNLCFWNTATGQQLGGQRKFAARLNLTYSPDGKKLAGGGVDAQVFDIATGKAEAARWLQPGKDSVFQFSPDGKLLISALHNCLRLWDAKTLRPLQSTIGHVQAVHSIAFSHDNSVVFSANERDISRWETTSGKPLPPFGDFNSIVGSLAISPNGRVLAAAVCNDGEPIWLLDATTGTPIRSFFTRQIKMPRSSSLSFSADGKTLISGPEIHLWEVATGKMFQTFPGDTGRPSIANEMALSPDGQIVACMGLNHEVRLMEVTTGKELRSLQGTGPPDQVAIVAFSPDGKSLASASARSNDRPILLTDVATGALIWRTEKQSGLTRLIAFSPDGRTLATGGSDRIVRLWEVATGKERQQLKGHRYEVWSGTFSRDGKLLATGSADTTVLVWDLAVPSGPILETPLAARNLDALWADLASNDARKAYDAILRLAREPAQSVLFLKDHLKVAATADDQKATTLSSEGLGTLRAIETLERIGTRDAQQVLEALARGADARSTREANASLERLTKQ